MYLIVIAQSYGQFKDWKDHHLQYRKRYKIDHEVICIHDEQDVDKTLSLERGQFFTVIGRPSQLDRIIAHMLSRHHVPILVGDTNNSIQWQYESESLPSPALPPVGLPPIDV